MLVPNCESKPSNLLIYYTQRKILSNVINASVLEFNDTILNTYSDFHIQIQYIKTPSIFRVPYFKLSPKLLPKILNLKILK